mgnify:CR=1 FL=1
MADEVSSRARRDRRRRQYLSLGLGELAAAAVFVGVALWHGAPLDTGGRLVVLGAVGPLAVVLVAAGLAIFAMGYLLSRSGEAIAETTGLGQNFFGAVFVAIATSLILFPALMTL